MTRRKLKRVAPGVVFNYWTVISQDPSKQHHWICQCRCGVKRSVQGCGLPQGRSKSCGCRNGVGSQVKHGMSNTAVHATWSRMRTRCLNPKCDKYQYYGGRGIRICGFIKSSPLNLLELIGDRPNPGMSLDRIDTDGHYSCGSCLHCKERGWSLNVRWASRKQQARNKSNNHIVVINGIAMPLIAWSERIGITRQTLRLRLKKGLDHDALTAPGKTFINMPGASIYT